MSDNFDTSRHFHDSKMTRLLFILALDSLIWFHVAYLASVLPPSPQQSRIVYPIGAMVELPSASTNGDSNPSTMITHAQYNLTATTSTTASATTTEQPTTIDPNSSQDDIGGPNVAGQPQPASTQQTPLDPNRVSPESTVNKSKPQLPDPSSSGNNGPSDSTDLSILFLSLFIVYVSIIKLIYHNVAVLKKTLTEPGILMIFGIFWELIARQVNSNYDAFPRFNSRIFFYLFLPSTVLEAAALLSNKWLFLNLFPILVHSIFGTLLNAASLGFTIYSLNKHNLFNLNYNNQQQQPSTSARLYASDCLVPSAAGCQALSGVDKMYRAVKNDWTQDLPDVTYERSYLKTGALMELNNLTLTDCLVFGTILSSVDSTTLLGVFQLNQVNERLYYLVLGEGLMNNAVVLVVINLLLDFFNTTRLTLVKVYISIIQFFITMIGSIFMGLLLASLALIAVRLVKRFQVPNALISYQNQCQTMVETLLILKLAYLTYTLAELAGTSSIVSLATYGILQDQYIKHNLNLRSQLTFRQVILATKTMGVSLVYPLLGMLLVEVTSGSQIFQAWLASESVSQDQAGASTAQDKAAALISAASKLNRLASRTNFYWNFKFLAFVMMFTVLYRFTWVILLSFFCNLFSGVQRRIKFKEQILVAYGGLKGPLAFAIVHRLVEQGESQYSDRVIRNKHPFIYTILCITFVSTIFKGSFIRPLVSKVQRRLSQVDNPKTQRRRATVFEMINSKLLEYTSHGLNSILGHSKSPYDRFAELNETRIKPYLSRDGSNTNWLSIFYDTLVLDETLNHNCFYRSIGHDPTLHSYWHSMTNITNQRGSTDRWQSGMLDTIDEQGSLVRRFPVPIRPRQSVQSSIAPFSVNSSRRSSHNRISDIQLADQNNKSILKELVLFNLKMDESKKGKRTRNNVEIRESINNNSFSRGRMLSTTSSEEMAQETSSFELTMRERYHHLKALDERQSKTEVETVHNKTTRVIEDRSHAEPNTSNADENLAQTEAPPQPLHNISSRVSRPAPKVRKMKIRGRHTHLKPRYKGQTIREEP